MTTPVLSCLKVKSFFFEIDPFIYVVFYDQHDAVIRFQLSGLLWLP